MSARTNDQTAYSTLEQLLTLQGLCERIVELFLRHSGCLDDVFLSPALLVPTVRAQDPLNVFRDLDICLLLGQTQFIR